MQHKMIVRCNKCGKAPPIGEKKTTDRFTVYKTKEPCECGGEFVWLHVYSETNHIKALYENIIGRNRRC